MARTHHRSPIIADGLQLEIFPKFVRSRPCSRASRLLCITCGSCRITQTDDSMARTAKTPVRSTSCDVLRHPSSRPPRLSRGEPSFVVRNSTAAEGARATRRPKQSNDEDSTTGHSGSLRDLNPVPDLSGQKLSHFCWLPTIVGGCMDGVAKHGRISWAITLPLSGPTRRGTRSPAAPESRLAATIATPSGSGGCRGILTIVASTWYSIRSASTGPGAGRNPQDDLCQLDERPLPQGYPARVRGCCL